MTDDQTLSDHDLYKAMHDAARNFGSMGSRKTAQSSGGQWIGGGANAINNTIANLYSSRARQLKAFDNNLSASEQIACNNLVSDATSCDAFGQATRDVANGIWSSSDQHLHERLMVQLQKDADDIRKTCAFVRDPKEPRVVEYKSGDDLMAVTRSLCLGK